MALVRAVLEGRLPLSGCLQGPPRDLYVLPGLRSGLRQLRSGDGHHPGGAGTGREGDGRTVSSKALLGAALKNDQAMKASAWLAPLALHYGYRPFGPCAEKAPSRRPVHGKARTRQGTGSSSSPAAPSPIISPGLAMTLPMVLERMGYDVVVPEGLTVLRPPAPVPGRPDRGAEAAARRNRSLLARFGPAPVVTACASCALTFKKEYPRLLGPRTLACRRCWTSMR